VLATYDHPHFGRWPLATTRVHGDGRITVVGTQPSPALGEALVRWVVPVALADAWLAGADRPQSVTVTGGNGAEGRGTVRFVHNWSWDPATLTLPVAAEDLLADGRPVLGAGTEIALGPWDVRVLREQG
jgi:beta-galactosidase